MTTLERCQLAKEKGYTYNHSTGELIGLKGNVLTNKHHHGYSYIQLIYEGKTYFILGHRFAWFLHYGSLPNNSIDHIDGDRSNNKIHNLRDVTHQQNQWNRTTAKGYTWNKNANKFQSKIRINGKVKSLGYYTTEQEARNAYLKGKQIYHVINT